MTDGACNGGAVTGGADVPYGLVTIVGTVEVAGRVVEEVLGV